MGHHSVCAQMKSQIVAYVSYILRGGFIQSKHWFATCQEAIHLLFSSNLCDRPDLFIQNVIKTISIHLFSSKEVDVNDTESKIFYKRYDLAKFLFILGNTAIKLLVYIEEKENELKRLKEADKQQKENKKEKKEDYELNEAMGGSGV